MKFNGVAQAFDAIEAEASRTKMTHLLAELFRKATPNEAAFIAYFSLGSLNPPYAGTQFNFAEKSLIKVIAQLLDISMHATKEKADKLGDLGLVVEKGDWAGASDMLSVNDICTTLERFITIGGTGSQEIKEQAMLKILRAVDPLSAKFIVRLVAGQLRLGFSDMTMLDAFSWMEMGDKSIRSELEDAYNISADIGLIIKTLKEDGLKGIQKIAITPGIPIRPAAAERAPDAQAIIDKIGPCVAQPKLDGFRLQVHIDHSRGHRIMRFFSRNLLDMSAMFPDLVHALKDFDIKTLVAEGEAICFDEATGSFLPFQETVKRKRKHDIEAVAQDYPLKLYLFDVLYMNGTSYLDVPHHERRQAMLDVCDDATIKKHHIIFPIEEKKIHTAKELESYFEQNISSGLEGLVVKRDDAIYQPGKRNFNWIKLKRQESGLLDDTVDCVILGYYFGSGKRASFGIGALLVGIYNKHKDCFQTVAKIGTGLTDQEWKDQKHACDKLRVEHRPKNVECAKELYPDVWISPEIMCMIRADEITRSPLHTAGKTEKHSGLALRFPRLMGYRPDKSAEFATAVTELERLFELQFKKKQK